VRVVAVRTVLALALLGMAAGCPQRSAEVSTGAAVCVKDDDCVRAVCCHANACVPKGQAPSCRGVMCSMTCLPYTIDCGGGCTCVGGKCAARLTDSRGVAPG
jgi:hypothetical protein